jgi:hypothetical protein
VGDPPRWPGDTPLSIKVGTKFRSVSIVRLRTKGHGVIIIIIIIITSSSSSSSSSSSMDSNESEIAHKEYISRYNTFVKSTDSYIVITFG